MHCPDPVAIGAAKCMASCNICRVISSVAKDWVDLWDAPNFSYLQFPFELTVFSFFHRQGKKETKVGCGCLDGTQTLSLGCCGVKLGSHLH